MKVVLLNGKILIPHPQDEKSRFIAKRRLEGKDYQILDATHYQIVPTQEEEDAWAAKVGEPKLNYYLVVTKAQLGIHLGLSGQALDDLFLGQRRSLDGTLCLYKERQTKQWYIDLPPAQKNLVYPITNPDPVQYPNLDTIYDYLRDNQILWEEVI